MSDERETDEEYTDPEALFDMPEMRRDNPEVAGVLDDLISERDEMLRAFSAMHTKWCDENARAEKAEEERNEADNRAAQFSKSAGDLRAQMESMADRIRKQAGERNDLRAQLAKAEAERGASKSQRDMLRRQLSEYVVEVGNLRAQLAAALARVPERCPTCKGYKGMTRLNGAEWHPVPMEYYPASEYRETVDCPACVHGDESTGGVSRSLAHMVADIEVPTYESDCCRDTYARALDDAAGVLSESTGATVEGTTLYECPRCKHKHRAGPRLCGQCPGDVVLKVVSESTGGVWREAERVLCPPYVVSEGDGVTVTANSTEEAKCGTCEGRGWEACDPDTGDDGKAECQADRNGGDCVGCKHNKPCPACQKGGTDE